MPRVEQLTAVPWNIELKEPFGIATGAQALAANVCVKVILSDGTVGWGEAAPFPAVNGETQAGALAALQSAQEFVQGQPIAQWEQVALAARDCFHASKSAQCALETALLDAFCKSQKISLWSWAGGAEQHLVTDITIPTGSAQAAEAAARTAAAQGFSTLKIKVGGASLDWDVARLLAVLKAAPTANLIVDGNAALSPADAIALLDALGPLRSRVAVFEQPTAKLDLDAAIEVRHKTGVAIAADESACSVQDVEHLAARGAADIINIKIMKSGVLEAIAMIRTAQRLGLGLMVGGMVESDVAMGASACIAAGIGGFAWVDLDTPLFMKGTPTRGGVRRSGARIDIEPASLGHGVEQN